MAAYHLGPFSQVGTLKRIGLEQLLAFLKPHKDFLAARGVRLPSPDGSGEIDYEGLIQVFMNPGADTPHELAEALYLVAEMATPEGMDELLQATKGHCGINLGNITDATPAEVAVQIVTVHSPSQ